MFYEYLTENHATYQKMSGYPIENKEVKLRLSMVTSECKTLCLFYYLDFEQVKQKKCNGTNIGQKEDKAWVDIFIYPGVCVLFNYFLKRFANLNSFFSMAIPVFLKMLFRISLKKMLIIFTTLLRIFNDIFPKLYPEETHLLLKEIVYIICAHL